MKSTIISDPLFPVAITPEEKEHGAKLIASSDKLVGGYGFGAADVLVAKVIIPAGPSRRLVKFSDPSGRMILWQIEAYGADVHFMRAQNPQKPSWQAMGDGPSSNFEDALRRANKGWPDFALNQSPPADIEITEADIVG